MQENIKGIFISMEGPDGSGKSTQIELLKAYLEDKGYEIIITREPGGTVISEDIRRIILNKDYAEMGYMTEALEAVVNQLVTDGYKEIIVEAVKDNTGSNRVIEKNGFKLVDVREAELSSVKPQMVTINSYRYYAESNEQ